MFGEQTFAQLRTGLTLEEFLCLFRTRQAARILTLSMLEMCLHATVEGEGGRGRGVSHIVLVYWMRGCTMAL